MRAQPRRCSVRLSFLSRTISPSYQPVVYALLLALLQLPSIASPPCLRVTGTLKGYFLTPQGQLQVRTLDLTSQPRKATGEKLHPVWSSYYTQASVEALAPIRRVRVIAAQDHAVLYDRQYTPPTEKVRVPAQEGEFLGTHARHGLSLQFDVTMESGETVSCSAPIAAVNLLPVPEPKIDWLDLMRITEMRRILREKGDSILPGFHIDDVPYALDADEGQLVLVDYPKLPEGFREYKGPKPYPMKLYVGPSDTPMVAQPGGETKLFDGIYVAGLSNRPFWFALPDTPYSLDNERESSQRLEVIIHEANHVVWLRHNKLPEVPLGLGLSLLSLRDEDYWDAEAKALDNAMNCEPKDRLAPARDWVAIREEHTRRANRPAVATEVFDTIETTEGLAGYAHYQAETLSKSFEDSVALRSDPFYRDYHADCPAEFPDLDVPHGSGYCQAELLSSVSPAEQHRVWKGSGTLREALAAASGFTAMNRAERATYTEAALARAGWSRDSAAQETGRTKLEGALRSARNGKGTVVEIGVSSLAPLTNVPGQFFDWTYASELPYRSGEAYAVVAQPALVCDTVTGKTDLLQFRAALPEDERVLWMRTTPQGRELRIGAISVRGVVESIVRRPHYLGIRLSTLPDAQPMKTGPRPVEGPWCAVPIDALPNAAWEQLPRFQTKCTLAGNFRDSATGQIGYQRFDETPLLLGSSSSLVLIPNESYTETITATSGSGALLHEVAIEGEKGPLAAARRDGGQATSLTASTVLHTPEDRQLGGLGLSFQDGKAGWRVAADPHLTAPPQAGGGLKVWVGAVWTEKPLEGARVGLWREGDEAHARWATTDAKGEALFSPLVSGWYIYDVSYAPVPSCHLQRRAQVWGGVPQQDNAWLYAHAGIIGKVAFPLDPGGSVWWTYPRPTITLLRDGKPVRAGFISQQPNADGSYSYAIGPPLEAGSYTVRATHEKCPNQDKPITVPDGCGAEARRVGRAVNWFKALSSGPHETVQGPDFTFEAQK